MCQSACMWKATLSGQRHLYDAVTSWNQRSPALGSIKSSLQILGIANSHINIQIVTEMTLQKAMKLTIFACFQIAGV